MFGKTIIYLINNKIIEKMPVLSDGSKLRILDEKSEDNSPTLKKVYGNKVLFFAPFCFHCVGDFGRSIKGMRENCNTGHATLRIYRPESVKIFYFTVTVIVSNIVIIW